MLHLSTHVSMYLHTYIHAFICRCILSLGDLLIIPNQLRVIGQSLPKAEKRISLLKCSGHIGYFSLENFDSCPHYQTYIDSYCKMFPHAPINS